MRQSVRYILGKDGQTRFRDSERLVKSRIKTEILYVWSHVKAEINEGYYFPNKITPYMKEHYGDSQIYRWYIYRNKPVYKKMIYIGETKKLCPNRINNILKPGPSQQTNKRLKAKFDEFWKQGYKIRLEVLKIDKMNIDSSDIHAEDLNRARIRKLIEAMLIESYVRKGYELLNLPTDGDGLL